MRIFLNKEDIATITIGKKDYVLSDYDKHMDFINDMIGLGIEILMDYGSLIDNYFIYNYNDFIVKHGGKTYKPDFIIIKEHFKNCWSSDYQIILSDEEEDEEYYYNADCNL